MDYGGDERLRKAAESAGLAELAESEKQLITDN
jgi:hypothetical protein